MFSQLLLALICLAGVDAHNHAKCKDIWDPDQYYTFQGGKAKGVVLGAYGPQSKIQFIGCRGDATGGKVQHTEIFQGVGTDGPVYLESCAPSDFSCTDNSDNPTDLGNGKFRAELEFGITLPFGTDGLSPETAFPQVYLCQGVDTLDDCKGNVALGFDASKGGEAPCCTGPGGKCATPASSDLASILCGALRYATGERKETFVNPRFGSPFCPDAIPGFGNPIFNPNTGLFNLTSNYKTRTSGYTLSIRCWVDLEPDESSPPPSLPPPFPPSPITSPKPGMRKDPHLYLPHGGRADFRGEHNSVFCMLSAKNVSLNVKIEEADFQWNRRVVHGTKMSAVYVVARTVTGRLLNVEYNATSKENRRGAAVLEGGRDEVLVREHEPPLIVDNVKVSVDAKKLSVRIDGKWLFTATRTNFPFGNLGTNRYKHLLDLQVDALYDADSDVVAPHGIFGQAYDGDGTGVSGKVDLDRSSESTTAAQAEGAIEGVWSDYKLEGPFSTAFKYSRFDMVAAAPRDVTRLGGARVKPAGASKSRVGAADAPADAPAVE